MDKLAQIGHLVLTALIKARELSTAALEPDLRQRVEELVKTTKGITEKIDVVAEATAKNGKLDRATVDAALHRILAAMKSVNDELDELLAKARG
jgi:ferritin-like metal-binding protein YciE